MCDLDLFFFFFCDLDLLTGGDVLGQPLQWGPKLAIKTAWKMVLSRVGEVSSEELKGPIGRRGGHQPRQS